MSIMPQTNSNIFAASISGKIIFDEFEEKLGNELKESIGREFLRSLIKEMEIKEDGWYFERLEVPDDKNKEIRGKFVNLNKVEYYADEYPDEHYILFEDDHRLQLYFKNRKELIKYLKLKEL